MQRIYCACIRRGNLQRLFVLVQRLDGVAVESPETCAALVDRLSTYGREYAIKDFKTRCVCVRTFVAGCMDARGLAAVVCGRLRVWALKAADRLHKAYTRSGSSPNETMRSGTAQAIVPVCARCAHAGRRVWNACWRRLRLGVTHPSSITGNHTNAHTRTHTHDTHAGPTHTDTHSDARAHTHTDTLARKLRTMSVADS